MDIIDTVEEVAKEPSANLKVARKKNKIIWSERFAMSRCTVTRKFVCCVFRMPADPRMRNQLKRMKVWSADWYALTRVGRKSRDSEKGKTTV